MVTAAMSWERKLKAKADRQTRYADRQEFDRVTRFDEFRLSGLVGSGRPEDYATLARWFDNAGNEGARRHAELIGDELRKAHKRANRSFSMFVRHTWKDMTTRTRFDLGQSAIHSCRAGGPGWYSDSRIQFRVKPEDRAEVVALGAFHKPTGRLFMDEQYADVWSQNRKGTFVEYPTAVVAGYTFGTSHRDTVEGLTAHIDGPAGELRLDTDYLGFITRYFPGAVLMVRERHKADRPDGTPGKPVVVRWNGEDWGLVMPLCG